jgi:hypothetical protein
MADAISDMVRIGADLAKSMKTEDIMALIEPIRDILDQVSKNPQVMESMLEILKELTSDERISQGISNLLSLTGPSVKTMGNALNSETVAFLLEIVKNKEVKEGIASLLSAIDPEVLGNLLPVIGSVLGAITIELSKNEKAKNALIGLISNAGDLMKEVNKTLMGE